jgi:hypothetical protein
MSIGEIVLWAGMGVVTHSIACLVVPGVANRGGMSSCWAMVAIGAMPLLLAILVG